MGNTMLYLDFLQALNVELWILVTFILIITFLLTFIVRKLMDKFLDISSTYLHTDGSKYKFLKHFLSFIIMVVGFGLAIYAVPPLRTLSVSLFAGAGILAVIIGFASQAAFSNIISGIFIVMFKPFRVNDRIKIGERQMGVVEDITLRHVVLRDFENKRIIIPNSVVSEDTIINLNLVDDMVNRHIQFSISYDSDLDKAIQILQEEVLKHPNYLDVRDEQQKSDGVPPVDVRVVGFSDSAVLLKVFAWAEDPPSSWQMFTDLNYSVKKRFDVEGIEIPFPYRTLVYKKDLEKDKNES